MERIVEEYRQHPITGKWITQKYDLNNPVHMARYIVRTKYVFPGGYELIGITDDGHLLCFDCIKDNYRQIIHDTKHKWGTGWQIVAITTDETLEGYEYCCNCDKIFTEDEE